MNLEGLFTLSHGLYVVSSYEDNRTNGQISNAVMQVTDSPIRIAIAIHKTELTHEFIANTRAFTVTVLCEQAPMSYIGRFGFKSGRDIDKFDGIHFSRAETGCPYPTDYALAYLDLRVVNSLDVGTHTVFVGQLVDSRLIGQGRPMTYAYYREVLKGKSPPTAPTYRAVPMQRLDQKVPGQARDMPNSQTTATTREQENKMNKYVCDVCGYVYDPEKGDPDNGVAPGTAFEDLPEDWVCPECGAGKEDFSPKD